MLATQNPIEQEGTYPLPEAQLDRFFFKLLVGYSDREELKTILDRTTTAHEPAGQAVADAEKILLGPEAGAAGGDRAARAGLRHPPGAGDASAGRVRHRHDEPVRPVRLVAARRAGPGAGRQGAGLLDERYHVGFDDIAESVLPALRHRVLLNFEGQAEGIQADDVLKEILTSTPRSLEQKLSA